MHITPNNFYSFQIFCVGITDKIDERMLMDVSSPPHTEGNTYFLSPDFRNVSYILERVLTATCDWQTYTMWFITVTD